MTTLEQELTCFGGLAEVLTPKVTESGVISESVSCRSLISRSSEITVSIQLVRYIGTGHREKNREFFRRIGLGNKTHEELLEIDLDDFYDQLKHRYRNSWYCFPENCFANKRFFAITFQRTVAQLFDNGWTLNFWNSEYQRTPAYILKTLAPRRFFEIWHGADMPSIIRGLMAKHKLEASVAGFIGSAQEKGILERHKGKWRVAKGKHPIYNNRMLKPLTTEAISNAQALAHDLAARRKKTVA